MIHEWMSAFREPRSSEMKSYFRTGPKAHLPLADGLGRKHPQGRQRRVVCQRTVNILSELLTPW